MYFQRLTIAQNGMCATRPTISYRTTIHASLHRPRDEMKWRDFLPLPKKHRRARSGARSEVGSLKAPSDVDLPVAPRPTESTPDLRIGTSALPMSSPLAPRDQEPKGEQTIISWTIHLTALFTQQISAWFPIKSYPFLEEIKTMVTAQNSQVVLSTKRPHLRANRAGAPPHMPQPRWP